MCNSGKVEALATNGATALPPPLTITTYIRMEACLFTLS